MTFEELKKMGYDAVSFKRERPRISNQASGYVTVFTRGGGGR